MPLDRPLALQLEPQLDEERRRGREVVDHDAHVLHALDCHALDASGATAPGVPKNASGKRLAGSVAVTFQGVTAKRGFWVRVR